MRTLKQIADKLSRAVGMMDYGYPRDIANEALRELHETTVAQEKKTDQSLFLKKRAMRKKIAQINAEADAMIGVRVHERIKDYLRATK